MAQTVRLDWWPEWFTGKTINEPLFCTAFLDKYQLAYTENSFFSPNGKVTGEAAKTLGVSKPTMYDLIHKGTIPSITVGRKILISRKALSDWLENGGEHGKKAC